MVRYIIIENDEKLRVLDDTDLLSLALEKLEFLRGEGYSCFLYRIVDDKSFLRMIKNG